MYYMVVYSPHITEITQYWNQTGHMRPRKNQTHTGTKAIKCERVREAFENTKLNGRFTCNTIESFPFDPPGSSVSSRSSVVKAAARQP